MNTEQFLRECTETSVGEDETLRIGRRTFLMLGVVGCGASLLALTLPGSAGHASGKAEALLLSCMDFRLIDATGRYMSERGLRNKYDHIILAGASLGALTEKYPAWNKTFWEHLDLGIQLHQIHKVIVVDHRDCGAYKLVLGEDLSKNPTKETTIHTETLRELRKRVNGRYPGLEVELLLMGLDGKVETIV